MKALTYMIQNLLLKQGEKMKRTLLFLVVFIFLLSILGSCAKPEQPLSAAELLDLGEKSLLVLNYEQAVVQFLKVIEIEPMNPRGYTGAAEAYIGLEQIDKAESVLRRGLDVLPNNMEIKDKLAEIEADPVADVIPEPPLPSDTEIIPEPEPEQNDSVELRELSVNFFGEIAIQNLAYELKEGDPSGNDPEGLVGYTWVSFDFVSSSIPQELAQKIKTCSIWAWQETPFTEEEAIFNCMFATQIWGEKDYTDAEGITGCMGTGFPTYEADRGKQFQVCLVATDDLGAAIGYCLADVIVPELKNKN